MAENKDAFTIGGKPFTLEMTPSPGSMAVLSAPEATAEQFEAVASLIYEKLLAQSIRYEVSLKPNRIGFFNSVAKEGTTESKLSPITYTDLKEACRDIAAQCPTADLLLAVVSRKMQKFDPKEQESETMKQAKRATQPYFEAAVDWMIANKYPIPDSAQQDSLQEAIANAHLQKKGRHVA